MANLPGTNVSAPVRPFSDEDRYPSVHANEALGGHHAVQTLALRDSIPDDRRLEGMTCAVAETGFIYQLRGGILNVHWQPTLAGGGLMPLYAADDEADADDSLPEGGLYRLAGKGRAVFVKIQGADAVVPLSVTIGNVPLTIGTVPVTIG